MPAPECFKDRLAERARDLGFDAFGVAEAGPLGREADRLREWLHRGYHGTMEYLARLEAERTDPQALLQGARSVLCFAQNYYHPERAPRSDVRIARYARGRDYHRVLRRNLKAVAAFIESSYPSSRTRICVDTAPVLEKAWAERAGLGWRGKHTNLVMRARGSWTLLGEILTTLPLPPDEPHLDFCGDCRRCLDACPTRAFPQPYVLDARRCISYLTIEHRGALTDEQGRMLGDHLFGCDACLEVCPWNRFQVPTEEHDLLPRDVVIGLSAGDWRGLEHARLDALLRGSAMRRATLSGLRRNAGHILRYGRSGGAGGRQNGA